MADALMDSRAVITDANMKDLVLAPSFGLSHAAIDRLTLTASRIEGMAGGLREIASFPDPVGIVTNVVQRPSGIRVGKMTVPIGVVGFIYESRPNVTADAAGITLKAGNAILLRGGKEASIPISPSPASSTRRLWAWAFPTARSPSSRRPTARA